MCLAVPMQVQEMRGMRALCTAADGTSESIDTTLVGPLAAGAWVLCFLGAAREVVSQERALAVRAALGALASAMRGDTGAIDAAFADLVGREPQLPEFLRKAKET